jgi:phage gpG-like protein
MVTYRLHVDDAELRQRFADWEQHLAGLHNLVLRRISERMAANSQQYFLTGQALKVGTGRLRRSITPRRVSDFEYQVGSNVVYARIHEMGGVITARTARNLAIPIDPLAKGKRPREIPGLFFTMRGRQKFLALRPMFLRAEVRTRRGSVRMRTVRNEAGAVKLLYLLKPSVTMPRRPYLSSAIDYTLASGQANAIAEGAVVEHIRKYWEGEG